MKYYRLHAGLGSGFTIRPLTLALALAIPLLHGGAALAAEDTQTQPAQEEVATQAVQAAPVSALPSVTVTAQKREESVQQVSTAITALGGDMLLEEGIGRSASEVLNYVPNASAGTQQHGRPRWWIRGIGAGQQQWDLSSPVGFYLDEVYISNASATGFPLFDLERVEVLRGPQGTLWGKNTTGGAISVVSKKPSFNESDNDDYVKVDIGSYNERLVQGGIGGVIIDERLAGRFSFHQENYDGHFENQFDGKDAGGLEDGALRGQLLAVLTPNLEALLNVHYRKYKTDGSVRSTKSYAANGVLRNGYVPSTDSRHVDSNAEESSDSSQFGTSLNIKWQLGRYALTSITGYEDFDSESFADGDSTPFEISRNHSDGKSRQFSQEFRIESPREDRWNWLAGLHYFREELDYASQNAKLPPNAVPGLAGGPGGATFNASDLNHKASSIALFGSTTYSFTDKFDTTFGLRWTRDKKEYDLNRIGSVGLGSWSSLGQWWNSYTGAIEPAGTLNSGTFNVSDSKTWNAITYEITPEYKVTPTDRVYFKHAHGVKTGGFNTAATNLLGINTVKPEKLDSYELGYKSEWADGRVNFNASVFYYDYEDIQINGVGFNPNAGTTVSYLQNADKASVKGAEFELEAMLTSRLHVNASLGLLDAEYKKGRIFTTGEDISGRDLVRSPKVTLQLAADYRIPLDNGGKVVIGGDARYLSHQYYYVTPQGVDANNVDRKILEQEGYTLANARVSYSTAKDKYTWTAYVNNLFDKEYKNHTLSAFVNGVSNGDYVYWGAPRTVGVSFITRW
ncbi:MAG TPA: TonB-dependent receptor [Methylophilaceae bacterium]